MFSGLGNGSDSTISIGYHCCMDTLTVGELKPVMSSNNTISNMHALN